MEEITDHPKSWDFMPSMVTRWSCGFVLPETAGENIPPTVSVGEEQCLEVVGSQGDVVWQTLWQVIPRHAQLSRPLYTFHSRGWKQPWIFALSTSFAAETKGKSSGEASEMCVFLIKRERKRERFILSSTSFLRLQSYEDLISGAVVAALQLWESKRMAETQIPAPNIWNYPLQRPCWINKNVLRISGIASWFSFTCDWMCANWSNLRLLWKKHLNNHSYMSVSSYFHYLCLSTNILKIKYIFIVII